MSIEACPLVDQIFLLHLAHFRYFWRNL